MPARAAHAAATTEHDPAEVVAETLATLQRDGIQAAERQVRVQEADAAFFSNRRV